MNIITNCLLPFFYIYLLAWLLQLDKKLIKNGFNSRFIIIFFIAKCLAGIAYTYIAIKYIPKADVPVLFADGLELYNTLLKNPTAFLGMLHDTFYINDLNLVNTDSSFIQSAFGGIRFLHFFFDLFSFGNIYTNTILFNGLAAWAFLRFWGFIINVLKLEAAGIWFFLMPSAFFYTTTIFKEGISFILIVTMLPIIYRLFKSFTAIRFSTFILLFIILFFFKPLTAVTFLGALAIWGLMTAFPHKKKLIAGLFGIITISGFFLLKYINHLLDLPQYIINRQQEFSTLEANSKIPVAILEPNFGSFMQALPTVLNNVFLKPLPGEGGKSMYYTFTIEIFCFWALLLATWFKNKFKANFSSISPLVWALFLCGMANLIIIGYTIPNIGAITRYRSIFLPFVGLFFWTAFKGNKLINKKPRF